MFSFFSELDPCVQAKFNLIKNKYINNLRVLAHCIFLVSFSFGGLLLENQDPYTSVIIFIAGDVLLP